MNTSPIDLNALTLDDLYAELASTSLVRRLIELMRDEDLGVGEHAGDISVRCFSAIPGVHTGRRSVEAVLREPGVVCGLATLSDLLNVFAPGVESKHFVHDGDFVDAGTELMRLTGNAEELLVLERPLLNILGRLSGVATRTAEFVRAVREATEAPVQILDTRKTTPGMRVLEKYAVRCGGGSCHRLGLHDAVMLKDNHIAGIPLDELPGRIEVGSISAHATRPLRFFEVEVDTLDQFDALLTLDEGVIDIVMLDNMGMDLLEIAVAMRNERAPGLLLESSGGVTLDTIGAIARTGVDRISIGSLTHGATWLDVGMDAV